MSQTSPILNLPYIQAAQAQKHVTHNEAIRSLDTLVQLSVLDDGLATPPESPEEGDLYIVAPNATGAWTGHDHAIAQFEGETWIFLPALTGWRAWSLAANTLSVFDGAAWHHPLGDFTETTLSGIAGFGLGATPGPGTPFVVRASGGLWDAIPPAEGGTGSVIQSINRVGTSSDAGIAWQSDYVTQGLFGFFGGSDLRLSVSADRTSFTDALSIEPATGIARQPARPRFQGVTNYDNALPVGAWTKIAINSLDINDQGSFDATTNLFTAPVDGSYLLGATVIFKQDSSNNVRMAMRLVVNGTTPVKGSEIQNTGSQADERSGVSNQVLVSLSAGDTVELQAAARSNNALACGNKTTFWGFLLP